MGNVVPFKMSAQQAESLVRRLSAESRRVILSDHAKERMEERDIDGIDLRRILKEGYVSESPFINEKGHWQCKVVKRLPGRREAGAVTAIEFEEELVIITVEWEDLR